MKSTVFPAIKFNPKKLALVLPFALALSAPAAFAQNFDVSTLSGGASVNSGGSAGSSGVTSYKTGEAPNSAGLSGNTSSVTNQQTSGPMGTLMLPPTGFGGLAPVFGGLTGYGYGGFATNPGGLNISISGLPGGVSVGVGGLPGMPGMPGGLTVGGLPGGLTASLPGVAGPPGGFAPGISSGSLPGMPGSFSDPTIGANFNVGGTNIGVSTDLNTIESGLSTLGSDLGF